MGGSTCRLFVYGDLQPPEGTEVRSLLAGRVPVASPHGSCDSLSDGEINYKGAAGFIPHLTILYLDHEQASTLLQFAFSFGRKVRAAPTNTKRKHSEEKHCRLLPSSANRISFFRCLFRNKTQ